MTATLSFLLFAAEAPLTPSQCKRASVQSEMTLCAAQSFDRADRALNELWKRVIKKARVCDAGTLCGRSDSDQRSEQEILKKGQRAWLQFRQSQCEYEGLGERGGSIEPMIVNLCLERLTKERIRQLSSSEN